MVARGVKFYQPDFKEEWAGQKRCQLKTPEVSYCNADLHPGGWSIDTRCQAGGIVCMQTEWWAGGPQTLIVRSIVTTYHQQLHH